MTSTLEFFLTRSVTLYIVQVLASSGAVLVFSLCTCFRSPGMPGADKRILSLLYPWIGSPRTHTISSVHPLVHNLIHEFVHILMGNVHILIEDVHNLEEEDAPTSFTNSSNNMSKLTNENIYLIVYGLHLPSFGSKAIGKVFDEF